MKDYDKWKNRFIEKSNKKHNNKYDYSKSQYKSVNEKVCVICHKKDASGNEHGEFWVTPHKHYEGIGCPKCSPKHKKTTDEFITIFKEKFDGKYDFSKSFYKDAKTKICVICHKEDASGNEHGEFWVTPNFLLNGGNCPKCSTSHKKTTQEFIALANKIHRDKYDYSKLHYEGANEKVCVICHETDITGKEHGEFFITPREHLSGCGCTKCSKKHSYNNEEFIELVSHIHNNRYDYSKTEYVNSKTKVCIICHEHGEFFITPSLHLQGKGCPKCGISQNGKKCIDLASFIKKAKEIHGDKYDYSESFYENSQKKTKIICHKKDKLGEEHGIFLQKPSDHLLGKGCPKCNGRYKRTNEEFIKEANFIHNNKYDYSKTEFTKVSDYITIICPIHGEFKQTAATHLCGSGCLKCSNDSRKGTRDEFITKSVKIHGNKYDYSKVEYENNTTNVCIICPIHGEFNQMPATHLRGGGCPECGISKIVEIKSDDRESFIKKAIAVHGNKYDYSKVEYIDSLTDVCIICPEHGEFWQKPSKHITGHSCQSCKSSILEKRVSRWLEEKLIKYDKEKTFDWLVYKSNLKLDFYLPEYDFAIECQGEQHFRPVDVFGGLKAYRKNVERDNTKKALCEDHGIRLFYINYDDNISDKLLEFEEIIKNVKK